MKNAITTSILFLLLIVSSAFPLNASENKGKYVRKLQSIIYNKKGTEITLSDGIVFKFNSKKFENELLQYCWKKGDLIEIDSNYKSGKLGLVLLNASAEIIYSPQVDITSLSYDKLPFIEKMVKVRDPNITYMDAYNTHLSLSDGSYWICYLWHEDDVSHWNLGDRLIVSVDSDNDATLVNYNVAISSEREYSSILIFDYSK